MRMFFGFIAAVMLVAFAGGEARAEAVESKFKMSIGGYIKLDAIHQDAAVGAAGGALGTLGAVPSKAAEDTDQTVYTARQSRLNFTVTGPEALGAKTRAFLEGDFYGGGATNSGGNLRMRHAIFSLTWDSTELSFGQFWDIFGPMPPSTLDFGTGNNIGAPNNPRVAQVRVMQTVALNEGNSLKFILGLQDPVQDFEENTVGNIAGQVVFSSNILGTSPGYWGLPMQPLTISLFGQYGRAKHEALDNGDLLFSKKVDTWGAGLFAHVPILRSSDGKSRAGTLSFEGQTYIAEGLDWNGATARRVIGNTVSTVEAAEGYGAIGQIIFYPVQQTGFTAGYGRRGILDASNYRDKGATGQRYNEGYFFNVAHDVGNVRLAAEYMRLEGKHFDPADDGTANRYQFSAIYFF